MTHEISNVLNYRKLPSLPHFYLITTRYFYCQIHAGLLMTFIWHTMASEINHRSVFFKDTHEDRFLRLLSMLRWFSQLQLTTLHVLANLSLLTYLLNKNAFRDSEKLDLSCVTSPHFHCYHLDFRDPLHSVRGNDAIIAWQGHIEILGRRLHKFSYNFIF